MRRHTRHGARSALPGISRRKVNLSLPALPRSACADTHSSIQPFKFTKILFRHARIARKKTALRHFVDSGATPLLPESPRDVACCAAPRAGRPRVGSRAGMSPFPAPDDCPANARQVRMRRVFGRNIFRARHMIPEKWHMLRSPDGPAFPGPFPIRGGNRLQGVFGMRCLGHFFSCWRFCSSLRPAPWRRCLSSRRRMSRVYPTIR